MRALRHRSLTSAQLTGGDGEAGASDDASLERAQGLARALARDAIATELDAAHASEHSFAVRIRRKSVHGVVATTQGRRSSGAVMLGIQSVLGSNTKQILDGGAGGGGGFGVAVGGSGGRAADAPMPEQDSHTMDAVEEAKRHSSIIGRRRSSVRRERDSHEAAHGAPAVDGATSARADGGGDTMNAAEDSFRRRSINTRRRSSTLGGLPGGSSARPQAQPEEA
jgi:hypothetical protein